MTTTSPDANPLDAAIASGDLERHPYPVYARLRREHPILRSERWNTWVVSRHNEVTSALKDSAHFSSVGRVVRSLRRELSPEEREEVRPLIDHYSQGLINSDPPDHSRMRKLVQGSFSPKTLERLKPHVGEIVEELLDQAEAAGRMEAVEDFTFQVPVRVIAELLGIPVSMREQLKEWSVRVTEFMSSPRPTLEVARRSQDALMELRAFFAEQFEERRRNPGDDVISLLVSATDEGDKLSEEELQSTCVTILIGGHETTTSLLASALWILGRDPALRARMRKNPAQWPVFVEETLRMEPPFQRILRVVKEPTEILGERLEAGDSLMLLLGSANRDEAVFDDPEAFRLERENRKHVSFGHGMHFCLGAGLARLEAPIALERLLARFPDFAPESDTPEWHDGMIRALAKLPLRLDGVSNA